MKLMLSPVGWSRLLGLLRCWPSAPGCRCGCGHDALRDRRADLLILSGPATWHVPLREIRNVTRSGRSLLSAPTPCRSTVCGSITVPPAAGAWCRRRTVKGSCALPCRGRAGDCAGRSRRARQGLSCCRTTPGRGWRRKGTARRKAWISDPPSRPGASAGRRRCPRRRRRSRGCVASPPRRSGTRLEAHLRLARSRHACRSRSHCRTWRRSSPPRPRPRHRAAPPGTTRLTRPIAGGLAAGSSSPVSSISIACLFARLRDSDHRRQQNSPMLTPGVAKRELGGDRRSRSSRPAGIQPRWRCRGRARSPASSSARPTASAARSARTAPTGNVPPRMGPQFLQVVAGAERDPRRRAPGTAARLVGAGLVAACAHKSSSTATARARPGWFRVGVQRPSGPAEHQ